MWASLINGKDPLVLPPRITSDVYRGLVKSVDLITSRVMVKQTDIMVSGFCNLEEETKELVLRYRRQIEEYIISHPIFEKTFAPLRRDPFAPEIVNTMIEAATRAFVGPMASVAGAIAEYVGLGLLSYSRDVIVENGGDIFIKTSVKRELLLLAESSDIRALRIAIPPSPRSIGVCTSSGKSGHSFSFGKADAVTVIGPSPSLADAAATAIANLIENPSDIQKGIRRSQELGVHGVIILVEGHVGLWGQMELLN